MALIRVWLYRVLLLLILIFTLPLQAADRLQQASINSYRADQALLLDIAHAGDGLVAVGDQGTLLRSDDGLQWQQLTLPFSVMLTAVHFIDSQQGWIAGHDGLLAATADGGKSWQLQLDGNRINRLRTARLQLLEAELQQQLAAEPDNEQLPDRLDILSWQLEDAMIAEQEGPSVPLLDLWFFNANEGYALGAYGLLLYTSDGGQSWQFHGDRLDNPDNFHLNAVTRGPAGDLYIAGEAGSLFRSQDQGQTWQTLYAPYEGSFFAINYYRDHLYLMGLRGHLYRSADGDTWEALDSGTRATLNGSAATQDQLLLMGGAGVVLRSRDGERFEPVNSGARHAFSAGVIKQGKAILVGEAGAVVLEDQL